MNDMSPDESPKPPPILKSALRAARVEDAERSHAVADLRGAELARLEMLRDEIEPVLAQIPRDVDMFDVGLVPGHHPRLFIDMIAFVEMAHDKRHYRFVQDTRHGRITLAETDRLDQMSDAVTAYMARRLIDREKALAPTAADVALDATKRSPARPAMGRRSFSSEWFEAAVRLFFEYLGVVALCVLLWLVAHAVYQHWPGPPQ